MSRMCANTNRIGGAREVTRRLEKRGVDYASGRSRITMLECVRTTLSLMKIRRLDARLIVFLSIKSQLSRAPDCATNISFEPHHCLAHNPNPRGHEILKLRVQQHCN